MSIIDTQLFEEVFRGVKITFSRWCISGIVSNCGCRCCREEQGDVWTEYTEDSARARSEIVTKAWRRKQLDWASQNLK